MTEIALDQRHRSGRRYASLISRRGEGKRFVAFQFDLTNDRRFGLKVRNSDFRLKDADGQGHDPILVIVGGTPATVTVSKHSSAERCCHL